MIVIRMPSLAGHKEEIRSIARELVKNTTYTRGAIFSQAPQKTACVIAIQYVLERVFGKRLPCVWIGDLPRHMVLFDKAEIWDVAPENLCAGDLLFVTHKEQKRRVTHVALFLGEGQVFHSSKEKNGKIEDIDSLMISYVQKVSSQQKLLAYIDRRNVMVRNIHKGAYLSR